MVNEFRLGRFVNLCSWRYLKSLFWSGGYFLWMGLVFPLILLWFEFDVVGNEVIIEGGCAGMIVD